MLDLEGLTRLAAEEPSVPAGHPFTTIAEAFQERVLVEVMNVLSGQVRSSLAAPSRKMSAPPLLAVLPVNVELPIMAALLDMP
jgi:hypothetical protein